MKLKSLIVTVILLLILSFNGMAQSRQVVLEARPKTPKVENVKVERINDQDILRVANSNDTIRIFLSDDVRNTIERMMQSNVGKGEIIKDIEGADVHILRVKKNMEPAIYFRNKMRKSISVFDEELIIVLRENE